MRPTDLWHCPNNSPLKCNTYLCNAIKNVRSHDYIKRPKRIETQKCACFTHQVERKSKATHLPEKQKHPSLATQYRKWRYSVNRATSIWDWSREHLLAELFRKSGEGKNKRDNRANRAHAVWAVAAGQFTWMPWRDIARSTNYSRSHQRALPLVSCNYPSGKVNGTICAVSIASRG